MTSTAATLIGFGCAAALATFLGGRLAIRYQDKIHLVLGFSAGAVMGVALFDLLPEAIETGGSQSRLTAVTGWVALGFIGYMLTERGVSAGAEPQSGGDGSRGALAGHLGGASLTLHSLLDGLGIGMVYQVSPALGGIMAIGVLAHDFSDGINTVHLVLRGGGKKESVSRWLAADALAPVVGIACTFLFRVSEHSISPILSLFCGFFLYIGGSELVPESHRRHPRLWTSCATAAGLVAIYFAVRLAKA